MLEGGRSATFAPLVDEFFAQGRQRLVAFLRWGKKRGHIARDLDEELIGTLLSGGYDRLAREMVRRPRAPDFDAVVDRVHQSLVDKVLFAPPQPKRKGGDR
jgi:hypothetical protein